MDATAKVDDRLVAAQKHPVARVEIDQPLLLHRIAPSRLSADSTHACSSVVSVLRPEEEEWNGNDCDKSVASSGNAASTANCSGRLDHVRSGRRDKALKDNGLTEAQPPSGLNSRIGNVNVGATTKKNAGYNTSIKGRTNFASGRNWAETTGNGGRYYHSRSSPRQDPENTQADLRLIAANGSAHVGYPSLASSSPEFSAVIPEVLRAAEPANTAVSYKTPHSRPGWGNVKDVYLSSGNEEEFCSANPPTAARRGGQTGAPDDGYLQQHDAAQYMSGHGAQGAVAAAQYLDASRPPLVDCPRCGAHCPDGVDCLETEICAAEPDRLLFAPYQPYHGPAYDTGNPFDRTNLALRIRRAIDSREDFIALNERLYRRGDKCSAYYLQDAREALADLRRHRRALFRLNEIGSN